MNISTHISAAEPQTIRRPAVAAAAQVERAAQAVSEMLRPMARGLAFSYDHTSGDTVVQIIDTDTNEVLRQIPNEEMLAIARALDRMQGLLINSRA